MASESNFWIKYGKQEMQEEPLKRKKFRDMEEAKPYVQVGGIDFVPALKARG